MQRTKFQHVAWLFTGEHSLNQHANTQSNSEHTSMHILDQDEPHEPTAWPLLDQGTPAPDLAAYKGVHRIGKVMVL